MVLITYLIGLALTVWCILDIFGKHIDLKCKIGISIVVLLTNWVGLILYYLIARDHLESWCRYR